MIAVGDDHVSPPRLHGKAVLLHKPHDLLVIDDDPVLAQLGLRQHRSVGHAARGANAAGLGRVKTPGGSIDAPRSRRGGHARSFFRLWRLFRSGSAPEADSRRLERFCNSRRTRVCDDYALITAMSGWTPKMFMTRVRL